MPTHNKNLFQFCTSAPIDELVHQCGSSLTNALNTSNMNELVDLSNTIETLSNIINLSTIVIESNIPSSFLEKCNTSKLSIKDASLLLLQEYANLSQNQLLDFINISDTLSENLWKKYVSDPDNITSEILDNFYDDCGEHHFYLVRYFQSMNISLGAALRGYIAHFAQRLGGKYFDFGGGIGNLTATISKLGHDNIYIVETDEKQLDFVKWKDNKCGIFDINYIGANEIDDFFELHKESFHFGTAIELLEHIIDPPSFLEKLTTLIAPGGYLFLTSSFHVYPHPGHLKSNVQYTDQEDELLKPYGFVRAYFDEPSIPFLFNWKLFQKVI